MEEELERLKSENRHLKETIVALRAELEKQVFVLEDRLDKERSALRDEKRHLQDTIAALRVQLEGAGKSS